MPVYRNLRFRSIPLEQLQRMGLEKENLFASNYLFCLINYKSSKIVKNKLSNKLINNETSEI